MSDATIGYSAEGGVARIVLDQPAKLNAMSFEMWSALPGAVERAVADPAVRVITVEGAGDRAFCAGADISQFGEKRTGGDAVAAYDRASDAAYTGLATAAKPTVAIIRGICFGGGMALAMSCDLRIAAAGSRFRIPAGRLGLGYGYEPVMKLLRRLGPGPTAEMLFTARILSAEDARGLGVLQQLYAADSFEDEAAAYVRLIAENAPLTLAAVKRTLLDWDLPEAERDPAAVAAMVAKCFASEDYKEGQAAFKARRTPRSRGIEVMTTRIGFVLPSTNTTVESDCADMRPPGVTNHSARVMVVERPLTSDQAFLEHVELMRAGIAGAIDQVITCKPSHLVMGVALEAFWGGLGQATALQTELETRAGVGVSMGGSACVAALQAMDCRRIAVLTPHQPRGDAMVQQYFEQAGFDVVQLLGLKCASPHLIAQVPEAEMRGALQSLDGSDVQALVQVGTALPFLPLAAAAERWLDKPVLAINAVLYWDALRRAGVTTQVSGHGRLLERF